MREERGRNKGGRAMNEGGWRERRGRREEQGRNKGRNEERNKGARRDQIFISP
jgi:hypothetical protein